jgi:hypothetical protein
LGRYSIRAVSTWLFQRLSYSGLILYRKGVCPEPFREKYQTLVEIRNKLEKLSLTQAWSLRETDLYDYQRQLDRIDESRVDGNFVDADGNFAELYVQRVCLLDPGQSLILITISDITLLDSQELCIYLFLDDCL